MPNQNNQKITYDVNLASPSEFFTPHADANYINAQDVVMDLVGRTKDISTATFNCFEGGTKLTINDEIVANLIYEIQTKLEMIERILPMAFGFRGEDK